MYFKNPADLRPHKMTHKDIICDECGKKFEGKNAKGSFQSHMTLFHGTERPFSCPICEMTFKDKKPLLKHTKRKHSDAKSAL